MSERNSTAQAKPSKPTPDFPLFPHASKRWAKKINGKTVYFGPWDDPRGAIRRFRAFMAGKPFVRPGVRVDTSDTSDTRPAKPYPDFPLFPHATKRWAKKIRGKTHYFGPWDDPDAALTAYMEKKDSLHAGRLPADDGALTVKMLVNHFLNRKQDQLNGGELSPRTWLKLKEVTDMIVKEFGKHRLVADLGQQDFTKVRNKMAKRWGAAPDQRFRPANPVGVQVWVRCRVACRADALRAGVRQTEQKNFASGARRERPPHV